MNSKNNIHCQERDDEYYRNKLLDTKITDFCLSSKTQEVLMLANVVTLRDLVRIDHCKVAWGKQSFTEASELLERFNLEFANKNFVI